jgi:hypothetical protein
MGRRTPNIDRIQIEQWNAFWPRHIVDQVIIVSNTTVTITITIGI